MFRSLFPWLLLRRGFLSRSRKWRVVRALFFGSLLASPLPAQQFRAAWADVFHAGLTSAADADALVNTLVAGKHNAVVVQVLAYMDNALPSHGAHWKSSIVARSSRVTASFDPLAYLCQKAHASGIEVHAWLGGSGTAMYRVSNAWPPAGNTTLAAHPEWFMVPRTNSEGGSVVGYVVNSTTYYALDMGSSDAQEYIVSIVRELVTNYPVDGIHWDDEIDDPTYSSGMGFPVAPVSSYPNSGLARYRRNTGFVGTPDATDSSYNSYRRRFKNELLARCQAEIQSIKTNPRQPVRHSSSVITYGTVPSTCNFATSTAYTYYSDWAGMLQNGWIDTAIPMNYRVEPSSSYRSWCDRSFSCWRYNRDIFMGLGAYMNTKSNTIAQLQYAYNGGYNGTCIYSYGVPANDGGDWWSYSVANLYTNNATVPAMAWRNPATASEGLMWGRVKDASTGLYADDAIVTVSGRPAVRTDGNGYYVATMIPAVSGGTSYSVTASKTGMVAQTTNTTVLAGDIVRYDFILNVGLPLTPGGLVATATSAAQINLTWTDNATNETGYLVLRSLVSGGPYSSIASLPPNSTTFSDVGLSSDTTYYYAVSATNLVGPSTESPQASATTFVNASPAITGQPQSQSVVVNQDVTFAVAASGSEPFHFQWNFSGAPISGATLDSYRIASAQYSDGGTYSVTVTNSFGSVSSSNAILTVLTAPRTLQVTNIWNIQAGSRTYVTSNNTERGICINPETGHILLVSRSAQISGRLGVFVLDANSGAQVGAMSTNGVANSATFVLNKIDAADDGVIYGANLTTSSSTSPLIIYRWSNEGATPSVAYTGSPDGGVTARWGDSFSVSGGGIDTRIIISGSSATNAIIFTTSDGTHFVANKLNPTDPVSAAEFSRGLFLGGADRVYVKNRGTTWGKVYGYSVAGSSATVATNLEPLDSNMIAIAVATNYDLLAGVVDDNSSNTSGHSLKVYDISSPSSPLVVSNFNFLPFGSGTNSPNSNFGGSVDTDGARIVALDTQNGVVALQILARNPPPRINSILLQPANHRQFQLNMDPGDFVLQASSDFTNWLDLSPIRTNGFFDVVDPVSNAPVRFYRTKY
jgi:uncharacterized lipoprotein YddW (UPF0748 family)